MRAPLALLVALATAATAAGCLSGDDPPAPAPDADQSAGGDALPWDLVECRIVSAWVPVDAARVAPYLPEGFEPGTSSPVGFVPVGQGQALLGMESFLCRDGALLDATPLGEHAYGSFWIPVVPPEALRGGVDTFFGKWDVVVPDDARRARLLAAGAPVHDGEATFTPTTPAGFDGPFTSTIRMGDLGTMTFTVVPTGPYAPSGFPFREFTPTADGGLVVWDADYEGHGSAPARGRVQVPPGSMAADILGGTETAAEMVTGTWTFRGSVTLPE